MNETDDRLAGDLVWEIFAQPAADPAGEKAATSPLRRWVTVASLIVIGWLFFPPVAVLLTCLVFAWRDFRRGRRIARTIPDKAGGKICARFNHAWGAWKIGMAALVQTFACAPLLGGMGPPSIPLAFFLALLLTLTGFTASSILTATGVWAAYRSGMRVWVGEGINRARTLLIEMMLVAFVYGFLIPCCVGLAAKTGPRIEHDDGLVFIMGIFSSMFVGPVVILIIVDILSRHVIANTPGKFGPKVSTVGKWNAPPPSSIRLPDASRV